MCLDKIYFRFFGCFATVVVFVLLFIVQVSALFAQSLTVDSYVEQVLDYSSALKSSQNMIAKSQYEYEELRRNFYPRLDAAITAAYAFKDSYIIEGLDIKRLSTTAELNLSQNIYSGSLIRSSVEAAGFQSDIARYGEILTTEKVSVAARSLYWNAVAAEKYREVAYDYLEIIEKTYNLIDIKYRDGLLSKNDLLLMLSRKKEAQFSLTKAEKNYSRALTDLNILRGTKANELVEFVDSVEVAEGVIIPALVEPSIVMQQRNEYNISLLGVRQSESLLKINRAQYLPKIAIGVSGNYGTAILNVDNTLSVDGATFLKITAPIFGWGMKRQRKFADLAAINMAQNSLAEQQDNIRKDIYDSYSSLSESYEQLQLTKESLMIASESLELSNFSYDEGVISTVELLSAQLSWISAYNSKIGANLGYRISLIIYNQAVCRGDL
ncbi:MAG: TolC family protein [Rikenellaceae bacterium]